MNGMLYPLCSPFSSIFFSLLHSIFLFSGVFFPFERKNSPTNPTKRENGRKMCCDGKLFVQFHELQFGRFKLIRYFYHPVQGPWNCGNAVFARNIWVLRCIEFKLVNKKKRYCFRNCSHHHKICHIFFSKTKCQKIL